MKKDKIAKDEVNAIYSKMKKPKSAKKDQSKETKDIKNDLLIPQSNVEMRTNSEILIGLLADDEERLLEKSDDNIIINNNNNEIDTSSGMKESDKNNSDKIVLEDEIEILVKVRQSGTMKSIVFQSNVFIFNNLQIPICLSFISPNEYMSKYNSNDQNINHAENKNKIILNTSKRIAIPINYILNKYRVYVCFYNKNNEKENKYSLLYENFSNLKQNLQNFIKFNEENSTNYKGDKATILNDN
jgi:hypothetical protein